MSAEEFRRRLRKLEAELAKLNPDPSTDDELIAALKAFTATPSQMEQVWAIAGEDIRTQVIRVAVGRRLRYAAGAEFEAGTDSGPVSRTIEILSRGADEQLNLSFRIAPTYDPEGWADPRAARREGRYVPLFGFKEWARCYLMDQLLGADGGLALRHQIDQWFDGGDPPIDVDRFPHESVYWLVLPIDGDTRPMFDARMLRLPTAEPYDRIGTFPNFDEPECWDTPEGRHLWTPVDNSGYEWF
jgi:hypothetical protein